MIIKALEIVLHKGYGGFSFNTEMALWLMENRNWKVGKDSKDKTLDLFELGSDYFYPVKLQCDSIELRTNQDLIDCIKALNNLNKERDYYDHLNKLKIETVEISLEVEDYDDGYERIIPHISIV